MGNDVKKTYDFIIYDETGISALNLYLSVFACVGFSCSCVFVWSKGTFCNFLSGISVFLKKTRHGVIIHYLRLVYRQPFATFYSFTWTNKCISLVSCDVFGRQTFI